MKTAVYTTQIFLWTLTLFLGSIGCGKKGDKAPQPSEGTSTSLPDKQVPLPDVPVASGQLILSLDTAVDASSVAGYIVGKQDLLKVEQASTGEFYINNVPAGQHDVIVVAVSSLTSLVNSFLLKSNKAPDVGVRLSKVEALNGVRTKKERLKLPPLVPVSGIVTLQGQSDQAGIDVYIPGTEYIAKSAADGGFSFSAIPVGTHNFYFEKDGFVRGQFEGTEIPQGDLKKLESMSLLVDTGAEGFMLLNDGASVSATKSVKLMVGTGNDAVVMKISENADFSGAAWKPLRTTSTYTFETDGTKTLYGKIANANGLESSPFSADILIASQEPLPILSVATVNCRSPALVLNISATSGSSPPTQMQVSSNGSLDGLSWETFASTKNIILNSLSGPIVVRLKDGFGRESQAQLNEYNCTVTLSQAKSHLSATSLGTKALFAGGIGEGSGSSGISSTVDIFDSATGVWSTANLSQGRLNLSATSVGTKALFAGGSGSSGQSSTVDIYDSATGLWSTAALSEARHNLSATTVGTKALFAGGIQNSTTSNVVDVFDSVTGLWSTATLSQARGYLSATGAGTKAIIAGGFLYPGLSNVVDIFDSITGVWSTATLSQSTDNLAATSIGGKALFAGGTGSAPNIVDIFDSITGVWSTATLSQASRQSLSATSVGTKALFAGGTGSLGFSNQVDIFDSATGVWSTANLSQGRSSLSATSTASKAFFAGGQAQTSSGFSNVVDIYDNITNTCSTTTTIDLTKLQ